MLFVVRGTRRFPPQLTKLDFANAANHERWALFYQKKVLDTILTTVLLVSWPIFMSSPCHSEPEHFCFQLCELIQLIQIILDFNFWQNKSFFYMFVWNANWYIRPGGKLWWQLHQRSGQGGTKYEYGGIFGQSNYIIGWVGGHEEVGYPINEKYSQLWMGDGMDVPLGTDDIDLWVIPN